MINLSHQMAQIAFTSYMNPKEGKVAYKNMGLKSTFIEKDGAQCYIVWNDFLYIIAFRGTEPSEFSDIKADLNALPDRGMSGGWVHNGFQEELNKIWDQVEKHKLENYHAIRDFYITGHSLGGAMATLAASRFSLHELKPTALYTFGSPRVGTRSFVKSFNIPHYRFVNNNDIVTSVPFAFLGYKHHGTLQYINFYGHIRKLTTWQRIKDQWRGRKAAFKKGMPFDGAYDHAMKYYVKYTKE